MAPGRVWNAWTDPNTGEMFESYSMLTMNCDPHPLLRRMHKPKPKLPPNQQDKRSVIPLESSRFKTWLTGSIDEALSHLALPPIESLEAGPSKPLPR